MKTAAENGNLRIYLEPRVDSSNAGAFEKALFSAIDSATETPPVLDAEALTYISSAGLRVLMKLRKRYRTPVTVENVSRDVYEIFETTGFTELLNIKKALRCLSIDGLEPIGEGATAKVYRLDAETIVKVFHSNVDYDTMIGREIEKARSAFVSGVPTAIPYDVVRVGEQYGTVYELLNARNLAGLLVEDREHRDTLIRQFAETVKEMHTIEVDPNRFESIKATTMGALPALVGTVCTAEELEEIRKIFENVPDRRTFVHADCHPGNIMIQDGKPKFIDLSTSGMGHPIYDMMSMYQIYHLNSQTEKGRMGSPLLRALSAEEAEQIWQTFLSAYLDTEDAAILKKAQEQIDCFTSARFLFVAIALPGLVPGEVLELYKNKALQYVSSGLEPLCF